MFELAETFFAEAYLFVQSANVRQKEALPAIRVLLFARILSGTEALVTLARRGFHTEADILLRSNMEALFRLAALTNKPEMLAQYLGEDYPRRRRSMEDIGNLMNTMEPRPPGAVTQEQLNETIRKIDREEQAFLTKHGVVRTREVKTWDWVLAGEQQDVFWAKYLMHSNSAHHAARDLERRLVPNAEGDGIASIQLGGEIASPVEIVLDALLLLARGLGSLATAFGLELPAALWKAKTELDQQYNELIESSGLLQEQS